MAKKTAAPKEKPQATVSKMGAIKQLLAAGLASPKEVAAQAMEQFGLDVNPDYVSRVKGELRSKKPAAKKAAKADKLDVAVDFCQGVGGVEEAKTLLEKIERIKNL